ncbi:glycosyltransferase family 2 protein [Paenibacillus sp. FSL K6-1217]|uniref:glycosyltransferase family 2 protein n=1 Tax=Paenibacillus sp. FSL K6-1217 TaxID=2921466 RepID=UPI00324D6C5B
MERIKISVVITVYNLGDYIERCVKSVLSQSLREIEILVINDGSTDESEEIIKSYAKNDIRIRYFKQKNSGVSVARNKGIENARGKYITFIDGDDYVLNTMLRDMYLFAESENLNMAVCLHERKTQAYRRDYQSNYTVSLFEYIDKILEGDLPRSACGILFNLQNLKEYSITFDKNMTYGEDMLFSLKTAIRSTEKFGVIPFEYYSIEEREGSAIRFMNINQYNRIELLANRLNEVFLEKSLLEKYKDKLYNYFLNDFFLSLQHIINSNGTVMEKKRILKEIKGKSHTKYIFSGGIKITKKEKIKLLIIKIVPIYIVFIIYEINNKLKRTKINE